MAPEIPALPSGLAGPQDLPGGRGAAIPEPQCRQRSRSRPARSSPIHALDFQWTHVSIEDPTPRDWPELAEQAAATGQPWADELASHAETFLAIAHFVDTCERPGPSW